MHELTRVCKRCCVEKNIEEYQRIADKPNARRRVCRACRWLGEKAREKANPERIQRRFAKRQVSRLNPERRAYHIVEDSARFDRRKGQEEHDLTVEWVDEQISKPCTYCKRKLSKLDMTLDRVDNTKGHLKNNLLPACCMCNYFRRDMPYSAWIIIAEKLPEAYQEGSLDNWSAGAGLRGKRKIDNEINNC